MARFYSFSQFLLEKEVALSAPLKSYVVKDLKDGKFEMDKDNVPFSFSVNPVPEDLDTYKQIFYDLTQALEAGVPYEMYEAIEKAQKLPYHFGKIFTNSLSLSNVKGLDVDLTDEQRRALDASEVEFLKAEFASLPASTKDAVVSYLSDLAERAAIVLEALFYYTRTGSEDKFFQGENFKEILASYQDAIDLCQEKDEAVYDGPYDSEKMMNPLDSPQEFAFWKLTFKNSDDKFILRAPVSPEALNSEDNVGKKVGLNFSILTDKVQEVSKDFTRFPLEDLEEKVKKLSEIKSTQQ